MSTVEIDHEDYWRCPLCNQECDVYNWDDEYSDAEYYYENPIYGCPDCGDIEWRVSKIYKIMATRIYINSKYVDPNNLESHRYKGRLKVIGQE